LKVTTVRPQPAASSSSGLGGSQHGPDPAPDGPRARAESRWLGVLLQPAAALLRSPSGKRSIRILLLALGVASTLLALQAFYFRPWLGGTSRLDGWLARNGCAIAALCTPPINLRNQMGVLAALAAVLCFGLAFYRWQGPWADEKLAAIRLPLSWTSGRMWTALLLSLFSLATVAYQGYQVVAGEIPRVVVWLLGIAGFLAAAVVLDASYLPDLFRTGANLAVAAGIGLIVVGAGCLMGGRVAAAWLLPLGGAAFVAGSLWTRRTGSAVPPWEHVAMLVLALAALIMTMSRAGSWRFAWVGDEWDCL